MKEDSIDVVNGRRLPEIGLMHKKEARVREITQAKEVVPGTASILWVMFFSETDDNLNKCSCM